uniref:HABP4_PAI-RBP1 domain-containing protein n=1 Tax=Rhabditophanes sp. KR3021 TaxID=114890 RepID=A0AC35UAM7_9BILA
MSRRKARGIEVDGLDTDVELAEEEEMASKILYKRRANSAAVANPARLKDAEDLSEVEEEAIEKMGKAMASKEKELTVKVKEAASIPSKDWDADHKSSVGQKERAERPNATRRLTLAELKAQCGEKLTNNHLSF